MSKKLYAAIVLGLLALGLMTTCQQPPTGDISLEEIYGVWRMEISGEAWGSFMFLNEDGSYIIAGSNDPDPMSSFDFGQYDLEGNSITFLADKESTGCPGYRIWAAIELIEGDKLQLRELDEECPNSFPGPIATFVRYTP